MSNDTRIVIKYTINTATGSAKFNEFCGDEQIDGRRAAEDAACDWEDASPATNRALVIRASSNIDSAKAALSQSLWAAAEAN